MVTMADRSRRSMPNLALRISRDIMSCMFQETSFNETIANALEILTGTMELGLGPETAVYIDDGRAFHHKLVHHAGLDWMTIPQTVELQDEAHIAEREIAGKLALQVPLVEPAEGELIGTVFLFPKTTTVAAKTRKVLSIAATDLARLLHHQRKVATNAQLADIAGMSPNEIYLVNPHTLEISQANHSAQIKTGYRADQILHMTTIDLKHDVTEERYRELIAPLTSGTSKSVVFDCLQRRRDGLAYEVKIKVWLLQHEEGDLLVELVQDESDNKRLLSLLHATLEAFPGGTAVLDENLRLTYANRRLYELVDIPPECFPIGASYVDMLRYNAERGDYGPGDIEQLVKTREDHARLFLAHSFERERADGAVLSVTTSPLAGGGCVVTYLDVTIRRKAEQELIRHRDRLEAAVRLRTDELKLQTEKLAQALEHEKHVNALQRQFVSMTSHEFRTPLAIIDGAAQRLLRKKSEIPADFLADKCGQIRSAVSRMVALMESFLEAGRLDNGKMKLAFAECSLADIVTQCARQQAEVSTAHNLILDIANLPSAVQADAMSLGHVFGNLISNAVKYAPRAPDITIRGWEADGFACVSVADNGVGIDADDIEKMFQLYFRARTSSGIAGTGIGLNFGRQIVELHGGEISVASERGKGSTFTVRLPIKGPNIRAEDAGTAEDARADAQAA
jgi:signal transduction histidine kinase/PAS domain-containing protein